MSENKTYFITTAIAYTSRKPHIGNNYEIVMTDAIARYQRMKGKDVFFLTGTDEHGQKIEDIAKENNIEPQIYVDKVASEIKDIADMLNCSYDKFIRTTEPYHKKTVQKIFKKLFEQGDIYKSEYEGKYCVPCESFWTDSQLVDGKCPDCARDVNSAKEEAYFLKLSAYQERLEQYWNENVDFVCPESRRNEMLNNFIKPGLKDLCVSRTSFKWGIPVDFDDKHIVYVWIDALSNYITALGYDPDVNSFSKSQKTLKDNDESELLKMQAGATRDPDINSFSKSQKTLKDNDESELLKMQAGATRDPDVNDFSKSDEHEADTTRYKKYWPADAHIIGKDILRFHTIYWPIILMALGEPLPKKVYGHPWLLFAESKMSKSTGNVLYADELVEKYGVDGTRYYLLASMPYAQDGNITLEYVTEIFNADLANTLGNLVNRTIAMSNKYFDGRVGDYTQTDINFDVDLKNLTLKTVTDFDKAITDFKLADACAVIINLTKNCNKYIDLTTPWILAKNEETRERLQQVLYNLSESIRFIGVLLQPIIPQTAKYILDVLKTDKRTLETLQAFGQLSGNVGTSEPLFVRIVEK
ncbi:hypothetical protein FACS1894132_12180 [Clostridia bacterium]|nr:hypothetical protein FACS1894132_12180 [Clostridia bacterium]